MESNFGKSLFVIRNNPGIYAILLGSGVSFSANIPTGWAVMCTLISNYALTLGFDIKPAQSFEWYTERFNREPDYSTVLDELTETPNERNRLLRSYFEPNDDDALKGLKLPTDSHKAIAQLMKYEFVRVVVTTNFDRLLEKALFDINSSPIVISTDSDIAGFSGLLHERNPVIIKINGDYLDTRIKNTSWELSNYSDEMKKLLSKVFTNFGMVFAGWSGEYDKALASILADNLNKKYSHYWVNPAPPPEKIIGTNSSVKLIHIDCYSDDFFPKLAYTIFGKDADLNSIAIYEKNLKTNISKYIPIIYGREESIKRLIKMLETKKLITLIGPAGIGKTALSLNLASRAIAEYSKGGWFVDLSSINNSDVIVSEIASIMGIKEKQQETILNTISKAIGKDRVLLILDNCEHLVGELRPIVTQLIKQCPNLRIITTSREALNVIGETLYAVVPLDMPKSNISDDTKTGVLSPYSPNSLKKSESGILFLNRARDRDPDFDYDNVNCLTIARILDMVDCIPLGIELCASMVRTYSPNEILSRIQDNMLTLENKLHADTKRQLSLYNAIDWSYSLLDENEKNAMKVACIFEKEFCLNDFRTLCGMTMNKSVDHTQILQDLIDKSMIQKIEANDAFQYSMLKSVRFYITEKISDKEMASLKDALSSYFYEQICHSLKNKKIIESCRYIDRNITNLRGVISHYQDTGQWVKYTELFLSMKVWFLVQGHYSEAKQLFTCIDAYQDSIDKHLVAKATKLYCQLCLRTESFDMSKSVMEKTLQLFLDMDDRDNIAGIYVDLGILYKKHMEYEKSYDYFQKANEYAENTNNKKLLSYISINLATTLSSMNRIDEANIMLERAISICTEIGDNINIVYPLLQYAGLQEDEGNLKKAELSYTKALKIADGNNDRNAMIVANCGVAFCLIHQGRLVEAKQYLRKAYKESLSMDSPLYVGLTSYNLALYDLAYGSGDNVIKYVTKSIDRFQSIDRKASINSAIRLSAIKMYNEDRSNAIKLFKYLEDEDCDDNTLRFYRELIESLEEKSAFDEQLGSVDGEESILLDEAIFIATGKKKGLEGLIDAI